MISILLIAGNAIVGGMETAVLRLVHSLASERCTIVVMIPFEGEFSEALRDAGAIVHTATMPDDPRWRSIQLGVELVRAHRINVIHAHLPVAHQLAAIVGRATRTPVLATIHAMHVGMRDLEAHRLAETHLCTVSEAARMHALAVGAAAERVHVIRNAIDATRFCPTVDRHNAATPLTVGYVARLSPEKHPLMFVAIAARVLAARPDARFIVAGDGPLRKTMVNAVRECGIAHRVDFRGVVSAMPELYRELDVMALTSWHEGTPLAILEAMASGVPVVATAVGGVPELVLHGLTGFLFSSGNGAAGAERILEIASDQALRTRMGVAARARVEAQFDWPAHVAAIGALWRELAAETRRRGLFAYPLDAIEERDKNVQSIDNRAQGASSNVAR